MPVAGCEYSRRGDVPVPVDADGDGFVAPIGGQPSASIATTATRRSTRAATDIVDDGIDQDCDGIDEPRPFVDGRLTLAFSNSTAKGTRVTKCLPPTSRRRTASSSRARRRSSATRKRCPFKKVTKTTAAQLDRSD